MKRRAVWAVLLAAALLALPGCQGSETVEPPEDVPPPVVVPEEPEPPAAEEEEPEEPYVPPYLPSRTTEEWVCGLSFEEIDFSLKIDERYWLHSTSSDEQFLKVLEEYSWYGDLGMFPFTALTAAGLICGEAEELDKKYYTTAVLYDAPCCCERVRQDSNYRQFNSLLLNEYRWYWDQRYWDDMPFSPKEPEPYKEPIVLDAAMFFGMAFFPFSSMELSVFEEAAAQAEWLENSYCKSKGYTDPACTEVTGLCILNGDSRTEADYFFGSRARDIRITINGEYVVETTLQDTPQPQFIDLYYKQTGKGHEGVAKPVHIQIECLSRYSGEVSDIYMMEIGVGLTTNHPVYH